MAAPFLGWIHPDVPSDALLVYARGASAVPENGAAGTTVPPFNLVANGVGDFGGTGYLFRPSAFTGAGWRARVVALGVGVQGWRRVLAVGGALTTATNNDLVTGLAGAEKLAPGTLGGADLDAAQLAGTRPVHLEDVYIQSDQTGANTWLVFNGQDVGIITRSAPLLLPRVSWWQNQHLIRCGGSAANIHMHAMEADPRAADNLTFSLIRRPVDPDGTVVGTRCTLLRDRFQDNQRAQLLEDGQRPELRPYDPEGSEAYILESEALGLGVNQAAAGILPTSARVIVDAVVACWREG